VSCSNRPGETALPTCDSSFGEVSESPPNRLASRNARHGPSNQRRRACAPPAGT
jgi:hypothetical protein